ncbi:type IV secretion system protein VirB7 [Bartonella sp. B35(2025)]
MKLITVVAIFMIVLTGCASLSGTKKPPRCDGKHTRILNKDKWNWDNKNIVPQQKVIKPIVTPVILNTLENEKPKADVVFNTTSFSPVSYEALFSETAEVIREK